MLKSIKLSLVQLSCSGAHKPARLLNVKAGRILAEVINCHWKTTVELEKRKANKVQAGLLHTLGGTSLWAEEGVSCGFCGVG